MDVSTDEDTALSPSEGASAIQWSGMSNLKNVPKDDITTIIACIDGTFVISPTMPQEMIPGNQSDCLLKQYQFNTSEGQSYSIEVSQLPRTLTELSASKIGLKYSSSTELCFKRLIQKYEEQRKEIKRLNSRIQRQNKKIADLNSLVQNLLSDEYEISDSVVIVKDHAQVKTKES